MSTRCETPIFEFYPAIGLSAADDWAARIGALAASIEAVVGTVITATCNLFQSGAVGAVAFDVVGASGYFCLTLRSDGFRELPAPERVAPEQTVVCSVVYQLDGLCISACLVRQFGPGVAVNFF